MASTDGLSVMHRADIDDLMSFVREPVSPKVLILVKSKPLVQAALENMQFKSPSSMQLCSS